MQLGFKTEIIRAAVTEIVELAPLFDAYRVFYKQESDLDAARQFLSKRLTNEESVIFMATVDGKPAGFTQLYYTFSSVSLKPFLILNDLFVSPSFRGHGIGEALLKKAKCFCVENGFKGLALETAKDNPAQKLYEKLDWKKDEEFYRYFWTNA